MGLRDLLHKIPQIVIVVDPLADCRFPLLGHIQLLLPALLGEDQINGRVFLPLGALAVGFAADAFAFENRAPNKAMLADPLSQHGSPLAFLNAHGGTM